MLSGSTPKERLYVEWPEIESQVKEIVDHLVLSAIQPIRILGIGRGGLIPAAMITYLYGCITDEHPLIESLDVTSYHNEERGKLKLHGVPSDLLSKGMRTLIVDDIVDSGATLEALKEILPLAQTAVLVYKETSSVKPDFCGHVDKDGDRYWYVFPWEQ